MRNGWWWWGEHTRRQGTETVERDGVDSAGQILLETKKPRQGRGIPRRREEEAV